MRNGGTTNGSGTEHSSQNFKLRCGPIPCTIPQRRDVPGPILCTNPQRRDVPVPHIPCTIPQQGCS